MFSRYGACINLGGFSNISFENESGQRIAFDVCPVNTALNRIAGLEGLEFDRDGGLARKGTVDRELLARINALDYYHRTPPKSLGREWFHSEWLPVVESRRMEVPDLMATVTEHAAIKLSEAIRQSLARSVLVTGGGAMNRTLIEKMQYYSDARLHIPGVKLIKYKEAMVFALLGLLRKLGEVNCLASVTGGRSDLSAGTVYYKS